MIAIPNRPIDVAYAKIEKMIFKLCHNAVDRYGGEFDEYLSAANLRFCEVWESGSYNPDKGALTTWMWWKVVYAIRDVEREKQKKVDYPSKDLSRVVDKPQFDFDSFCREVSGDAGIVARFLTEAPEELAWLASTLWKPSRANTQGFYRTLWRKLKPTGWSLARVADAYQELREVIA